MPYILRIFFSHNFYFPAQLVGGFTLGDLLDKAWSQLSSLSPPRYVPSIFIAHRVHSVLPLLVDFHRKLPSHPLARSAHQFLCKKKSLRVWALGENWTREIGFGRHEDLPSHRGLVWNNTKYLHEKNENNTYLNYPNTPHKHQKSQPREPSPRLTTRIATSRTLYS